MAEFDLVTWIASVEKRLAETAERLASHSHPETMERLDAHDSQLSAHTDWIASAHMTAMEAEATAEEALETAEEAAEATAETTDEATEATTEANPEEPVEVQRHQRKESEPAARPFRVL